MDSLTECVTRYDWGFGQVLFGLQGLMFLLWQTSSSRVTYLCSSCTNKRFALETCVRKRLEHRNQFVRESWYWTGMWPITQNPVRLLICKFVNVYKFNPTQSSNLKAYSAKSSRLFALLGIPSVFLSCFNDLARRKVVKLSSRKERERREREKMA